MLTKEQKQGKKESYGERKDGSLRTCATATDGAGCQGFSAAALAVSVYVRVREIVCKKHQAQGAREKFVILAGPWGHSASHCPSLYPLFMAPEHAM